jgi:translocation and assembly module TamB
VRGKARIFLSVPVLILAVLLVCAIAFIKSDFAAERVCSMLRSGLQERLGVPADVTSCTIDLLPPALEASGLDIKNKKGDAFLAAESMRVELDSLSLLAGDFQVDRALVRKPRLHLRLVDGVLADVPGFGPGAQEAADARSAGEPFRLPQLPERIELKGGQLDLVIDGWGLAEVRDLDLSLFSEEGGRLEAVIEVGGGRLDRAAGEGTSFVIQPGRCKGSLDEGRMELDRCALGLGEASLKVSGSLAVGRPGLAPQVRLSLAAPLAMAHALLPQIPPMQGRLVLSADASPGEDGPELRGELDLKGYGVYTLEDVDVLGTFSLKKEWVRFEQLRVTCPGGRVSGLAQMDLTAPYLFSAELTLEHADLFRSLLLGGFNWRYIELAGPGELEVKGQLTGEGAPFIKGKVRMQADRLAFFVDPNGPALFRLNGASVTGEAHFNSKRIRISNGRVVKGDSVFEGQGSIHFGTWALDAKVNSSRCQLADVSPIMDLAASGGAGFEIDIGGQIFDPRLSAQLYAHDLNLEGHPIGYLRGRVAIEDFNVHFDPLVLSRYGGTARLTGSVGLLPPHPVDLMAELVRIRLPELVAAVRRDKQPDWIGGLVGGRLAASGTLQSPALDFRLAFADLRWAEQHFAEAGAVGRYEKGAWKLDLLEARLGPGWIFARGEIGQDLNLNLVAYSTGLRASSFQALVGRADLLDFRLDLHLAVQGALLAPALDGWAKFYDTEILGLAQSDSSFTAKATRDDFQVRGKVLGGGKLVLTAQLLAGLPFEAKLEFASRRLGEFLPRLDPVKPPFAELAGAVEAQGKLLEPANIQASLSLARAGLDVAGLRFATEGSASLRLEQGRLAVGSCELVGPETRLSLSGGGLLAKGPRLRAEGSVGLGLIPLLTASVPRAVGRAKLRLSLDGDWSRPRLSGALAFSAERLRIAALGKDLLAVTGEVRLTPDQVELTKLTGRFGGGGLVGWGTLDLTGFNLSRVGVTLELDRVRYAVGRGLWGRGTGTLTLTREREERFRLAGQIRVAEGGFSEKVSLVSFDDGMFRRRRPRTRVYDKKNEFLDLDIRLIIPEKFNALYDLDLVKFQAEMKGEVRVTGTNERLGLVGTVESLGGEVSYLSKGFPVGMARVQFNDRFAISPQVEIRAARQEVVDRGDLGESDYRIDLGLFSDGDHFRVKLHSEPPLDESDIVTLLSLGLTSRDMEQIKGDDLVGLGGEIFLRSLKADERLRKVFPFPLDVIQPRYLRVRSRYSNGQTSPHLETGVRLRFISDDLDLDYSRALYDQDDQSLGLSYQLQRGISTHLRWEDTSDNETGDFGLDLKLNWEW